MVPFLLLVLPIITGYTQAFTIPRIVGGYEASIKDFPYIVSIHIYAGQWCGGAIIKPDMIVTAAHCFEKPYQYEILAGTDDNLEGGQRRRVVAVTIHPYYYGEENRIPRYDLAVLRLEFPLDYIQGKIQNVNLPKYSKSVPLSWGKVAGWGENKSPVERENQLRAVELEVYSQEKCESIHHFRIPGEMFCAGNIRGVKNSCGGDSGGPFVINDTLYGVVSFGLGDCTNGQPGFYTNIPFLVDWIKAVAEIPN